MKRREFLKRTGALAGVAAVSGLPSLAHAAGNVVMNLHDWDVDFGAWVSMNSIRVSI